MRNAQCALAAALCLFVGSTAVAGDHSDEKHADKTKIQSMDSDSDGRVSMNEWTTGSEKHFKRMDANNDGQLDKNEQEKMANVWSNEHMTKEDAKHNK